MMFIVQLDGRQVEVWDNLKDAKDRAAAFLHKSDDVMIEEYPDDARVPMGVFRFDGDVGWVRREAP